MSRNTGFQWGIDLDDMQDGAVAPRGDVSTAARSHRDGRRKPRPAVRVGGMHCRRNKRWTWGHGQSARLADVKAVARCVALFISLASSTAMGNGFTWVTIGDPGNPGNAANNNYGSVAYTFRISAFETTNAQYAAFLNSADPDGLNAKLLWSGSMSITRTPGSGSGSKYSVNTGADSRPVVWVSWNSAARFVNWLTTGGTSTETGSYDMTNPLSPRLPTARYVLPSFDEYYKASFYTGSDATYTLYQTNWDSAPIPSGSASDQANRANFGGSGASPASTGPLDVGSFTETTSAYGLFDALGNVTEFTDTTGFINGSPLLGRGRVGGGWSLLSSELVLIDGNATPLYGNMDQGNNFTGFRIAAVPEPGTISMAIMGGVALLGAGTLKRRRGIATADTDASIN